MRFRPVTLVKSRNEQKILSNGSFPGVSWCEVDSAEYIFYVTRLFMEMTVLIKKKSMQISIA